MIIPLHPGEILPFAFTSAAMAIRGFAADRADELRNVRRRNLFLRPANAICAGADKGQRAQLFKAASPHFSILRDTDKAKPSQNWLDTPQAFLAK
jgi:hypothetical protein